MRRSRPTTFVAALASLGAGGIHIAASASHLRESIPLGIAFVAVGWAQLLLGAGFWGRPNRSTAAVLTVVHLTSIGAWAVSRSVGLPFGHPGREAFGVGDLTAVVLQVIAIAALAVFLREPVRGQRLSLKAALVALVVVIGGASVAVADVSGGHGTVRHGADGDGAEDREDEGEVHDGVADGGGHDDGHGDDAARDVARVDGGHEHAGGGERTEGHQEGDAAADLDHTADEHGGRHDHGDGHHDGA